MECALKKTPRQKDRNRGSNAIGFTCEAQHFNTFAQSAQTTGTLSATVGPQYDTTHVYVGPQDFNGFVASLIWVRRSVRSS
jgi:hypothetical protein